MHFYGSSACSAPVSGELEDQFFATVFLGSGLLFVACLFVSSAVMGALIESVATGNPDSSTYYFGRRISDAILNLFAMKMAGAFMMSICKVALRTAIFPRWVAFCGLCMRLDAVAGDRRLEVDQPGFPALDAPGKRLDFGAEFGFGQPKQSRLGDSAAEGPRLTIKESTRMAEKISQNVRVFDDSTTLAFDRTRAAHERTMMSWIRTATSLITFGFSIYKFFQLEAAGRERQDRLIGPRDFALMLVSIGLISLVLATVEHRQNIRALGVQYAGKQRSLAVLVAGLISLLGILALIVMILRA